uniref:Neurogenic differentiation factor 6-B-like n=1 Tax=Sinocyclocheilus rhinocerous TaxID=307959 RepID=A0A673IEF3_9TELE
MRDSQFGATFTRQETLSSAELKETEDDNTDREEEEREEDEDGVPKKKGPRKKKFSDGRTDRVKLRRQEANTRERSRINFLTDHNGDVSFSGRPQYDSLYGYPNAEMATPTGLSSGPRDGVKPFRPYNYYASYESYYDSASPENSSPHFDGQMSPPINYNGIFSLKKHEDQVEYSKNCHYGMRYCNVPGRGSMYRVSPDSHFPYDLHPRSQSFQSQDELNTGFHN